MKKRMALVVLAVLTGLGGARAGEGMFDEFMGSYFQRTEGVTPGAGNAKAVNATVHAIDPAPRRAGNRRLSSSGERMTGAIRRYQDVAKVRDGAPALAPEGIRPSGVGGAPASGGR